MGGFSAPLTALPSPTRLSATASGRTVTISWSPVDGSASYDITCGTETKMEVVGTTVQFEMAEYATQYTVSVIANPVDTEINTKSLAATTTVTTEADPDTGQTTNTAVFDFKTIAESPEKPSTPDGLQTEDGNLVVRTKGSWKSDNSGIFLGTDKEITIEGQNEKKVIKIVMTPGTGSAIKISSWSTDVNDGAYDGASYTWQKDERGTTPRYVRFKASSASTIGKIEVTYE